MNQIKTGEFLKTLRKEKGLTQEQFAEMFGTTNRSVSRWENGNTMPDISILVDIADYYEVDIGEIIAGKRKEKNMNTEPKTEIKAVAEYAENEKTEIKKKNKKKIIFITTAVVLFFIVCGVISNFIVGNPITYLLVKYNAESYVSHNSYFVEYDYKVKSVNYDFVIGNYIVTAQINDSSDSEVSLYYGFFGNYLRDDLYEVLNFGKNVAVRMDSEYTKLVKDVLAKDVPSEEVDIALASIAKEGDFAEGENPGPVKIIPLSELNIDEIFDYSKLGEEAGMIEVSFNTKDLSAENMSEKLVELKNIFDRNGIKFAVITIMLIDRDDTKNDGNGYDIVAVYNFPYSEITEDGLSEKVSKCMTK